MRKKKIAALGAAVLMVISLTGCVFDSSVEEMFTLPQAPLEYEGLMEELNRLVDDGYEYLSPASGKGTQSVQMVDLNNDGQEEAVAFFRRAEDEKPLKIFVFQNVNEDYELLCTMASSGSSIDSVYYEDLTGDGKPEIIVGWKISTDLHTLAAYSVGREFISLINTSYIRFALQDINQDEKMDLLVILPDNKAGTVCQWYEWQADQLLPSGSAALSSTAAEIGRGTVINGQLHQGENALFITGVSEELSAVTDILISKNGYLTPVAADERSGKTTVIYPYQQLPPQDINGDGVTEIPSPVVDDILHPNMVAWYSYQTNGQHLQVEETYHSQTEGWYFAMPPKWWGSASAAYQEASPEEHCVVISVNGQAAVALYTLTGDDRETLTTADGRFLISRQTLTNYAGKILDTRLAGITADELRHSFYLTGNTWG